ncbi:MAG: sulfotransferase family protein, partial [Gammaproteobacteria bacterium]
FIKVLELNPAIHEAHVNLGILYKTTGYLDQAVHHLQKALQLQPDFVPAWQTLGIVHSMRSQQERAAACFSRQLELDPGSLPAMKNMGNVYYLKGDYAQAEFWYRRALAQDPHNLDAKIGLGDVFLVRKEKEKLGSIIDELIRQYPVQPVIADLFGKSCFLLGRIDEAHAYIDRCIDQCGAMSRTINPLLFRKGDILHKKRDYDQAFRFYQQANRMKGGRYRRKWQEQITGKMISLFDRDYFSHHVFDKKGGEDCVFVIGMPRSGTSLMEQILDSHSMAKGTGELMFMENWASQRLSGREQSEIDAITEDEKERARAEYREFRRQQTGVRDRKGVKRYIDKMPTNFFHLGFILTLFPEARIIHMRRHPMDTCLSIYFQDFGADITYSHDLKDVAHFYGQYTKLMNHWEEILGDRILTIDYESLVDDIEGNVRRVLEYCQLPWEENCLHFHSNNRLIATASASQVNQPLYRHAVQRWKHYEEHLQPL